MKDDNSALRCEACGRKATVHIRPDAATDTLRHLCLACANTASAVELKAARDRRLDHAAILLVVGLLVLVMSLGADALAFGRSEGFGLKQDAGLGLGALLVLIGLLARVPTLVMLGAITFGITLLADWLGFGSAEGFGVQQTLGTVLGGGLMLAGLIAGRRRR